MRHEFTNDETINIDSSRPNRIQSVINITELSDATIAQIEVHMDVTHSWTGDLTIQLLSPDGTAVVLVNRRGGFFDDFQNTIFRADAQTAISNGVPPFRGTFRPEGDLSRFKGMQARGEWVLEIIDNARQDGGSLNRWGIAFDTSQQVATPFSIDVRFSGGLSPSQQAAFSDAAARWSEVITGELPPVIIDGERIDDILILAEGISIDGPGGVLGRAGPTHLRPLTSLPARGIMSFDQGDLARMEAEQSLTDVILHEMAHVLGFGTLWNRINLIAGAGSANPEFVGVNAMREYAELASRPQPTRVPVANTGGAGTRDGHWRESEFGNELLTGFLSGAVRPLSRTSIGAFEDMGYAVNYDAADDFSLATAISIAAARGLHGAPHVCELERTEPVVIPLADVINTLE